MGNAAAVGSSGSEAGTEDVSQLSSDEQLEKLANQYKVPKAELQLLRRRFDLLDPDEDGLIDRSVFQRPPYSSDPFCRQIWNRLTGHSNAPNKISFQSFVRTMMWWEHAPVEYKLQSLFSWMKGENGITLERLAKILGHTLPEYQQEELEKMSEQIIAMMSSSAGSPILNLEDFLKWFDGVPEGKLKDALDFKIL